jgi:hypothetical protein
MRTLALAMTISFLALGCAGTTVTATTVNPAPRAATPRRAECVEIFASGPPAAPHVDVALLEVEQTNEPVGSATQDMVRSVRERAGQMGCDAVHLGERQELSNRVDLLVPHARRRMRATCIVYREPRACTYVPPPPRTHRMCRDRADFDAHRNCIMPMP